MPFRLCSETRRDITSETVAYVIIKDRTSKQGPKPFGAGRQDLTKKGNTVST